MEMVLRCVVSAVVSVVGKAVLEEAPGLFVSFSYLTVLRGVVVSWAVLVGRGRCVAC